MKHNDYSIIGSCKQCHKPIMTPARWIGIGKSGRVNPRPRYMTCKHPLTKDSLTAAAASLLAKKGLVA